MLWVCMFSLKFSMLSLSMSNKILQATRIMWRHLQMVIWMSRTWAQGVKILQNVWEVLSGQKEIKTAREVLLFLSLVKISMKSTTTSENIFYYYTLQVTKNKDSYARKNVLNKNLPSCSFKMQNTIEFDDFLYGFTHWLQVFTKWNIFLHCAITACGQMSMLLHHFIKIIFSFVRIFFSPNKENSGATSLHSWMLMSSKLVFKIQM